jgi:mRNA interferase RelE/StbE
MTSENLQWRIVFEKKAEKYGMLLDKHIRQKIVDYLDDIVKSNNPRSKGKALTANKKGIWRYRVGDYRILCKIKDQELTILTIDICHRRDAYGR